MHGSCRERGFTLIELMTVAIVIGLLSAIAIPNFMNAVIRAKVARSQSELEVIGWALELYRLDARAYPPNATGGVSTPGDLVPLTHPVPYLSSFPQDPFLAPADRDRHQFVNSQRNGHFGFYYLNFLQWHDEPVSLSTYGLHGSANTMVYGLGPAYNTDVDPQDGASFTVYSPSNGTISRGLILITTP